MVEIFYSHFAFRVRYFIFKHLKAITIFYKVFQFFLFLFSQPECKLRNECMWFFWFLVDKTVEYFYISPYLSRYWQLSIIHFNEINILLTFSLQQLLNSLLLFSIVLMVSSFAVSEFKLCIKIAHLKFSDRNKIIKFEMEFWFGK